MLFVCGEIDCREGLVQAVLKGKHATLDDAVRETVDVLVQALSRCSAERESMRFLVLPVPPPVDAAQRSRAVCVSLFNEELRCRMADEAVGRFAAFVDYESDLGVAYKPQNGDEKLSAELTQCLSAKKRRSASLAKAPSLRPELNADGIHMNANFLPLLERELKGVSRNASQRK